MLCLSWMCVYVCDFAIGIIFRLDTLAILRSVCTVQYDFVVWGQILVSQFFSTIFHLNEKISSYPQV